MSVPPPPTSPRPSALRSLLLLAAVLVGLVVVRWSVTGGLSRPLAPPAQPRVHAPPAPPAGDLAGLRGALLYMGGRQVLAVDAASGTISSMPSPGSDRVWLVSQDETAPEQAYVLREVELTSNRKLRRWTLPYDAEPVAVVPQGVVIRDLQNRFEVRDPHGRRIVELGHDLTFLDRHGSLLAYLDDRRLHLHDLATGVDRTLASPTGARSWFALGPPLPGMGCCLQIGAFSPDARLLAVFTQLAGPGQPGLSIVDVASGRASVLPGSGGATPLACQPCLGWSHTGWLFFFNGGAALADPAAWRPGAPAAIPLALDLRDVTTVLPSGLAPG